MKRLIHNNDKSATLECLFSFRYFDKDKHTYDPWVLQALHSIFRKGYHVGTYEDFIRQGTEVAKAIFSKDSAGIVDEVEKFARLAIHIVCRDSTDSNKVNESDYRKLYSDLVTTYMTKNWSYASSSDPSASFYNILNKVRCGIEFKIDTIVVDKNGLWSNVEAKVSFPAFSVFTRILDKVQRVESMTSGNNLYHESVEDSLEDAIVYSAILIGLLNREDAVDIACEVFSTLFTSLSGEIEMMNRELKEEMQKHEMESSNRLAKYGEHTNG